VHKYSNYDFFTHVSHGFQLATPFASEAEYNYAVNTIIKSS